MFFPSVFSNVYWLCCIFCDSLVSWGLFIFVWQQNIKNLDIIGTRKLQYTSTSSYLLIFPNHNFQQLLSYTFICDSKCYCDIKSDDVFYIWIFDSFASFLLMKVITVIKVDTSICTVCDRNNQLSNKLRMLQRNGKSKW